MTAPKAKKKRPATNIQKTVLRRNFPIFHHSRWCVGDGAGGAVEGGAVVGGAVVGSAVVGSAVVGGAVVGSAVVGVTVGTGVGVIVVAFEDGATLGDTVVPFP